MKPKKILKQAKQSTKNRYVRKKDFKKLTAEVKRLRETLRKLEGCCGEGAPGLPVTTPQQPETTEKAAPPAPVGPGTTDDNDLKRISGIGPVLESKLKALGIASISQVASLTQADIDRISEHLNFKGRIERDEWVKQARDLGKT